MPRSGTTLTESILATAKNIKPGGERVFFSMSLRSVIQENINPNTLDFKFFGRLGELYLESLKTIRGDSHFFIDKLPDNYFFYKFIKIALPGAKFIHTFRNPWDNAISLFKVNYQTNLFYASSFFGIANEYANYQNLIKFWQKIDGNDVFFNVEYERLVSNENGLIEKLWKFCNLEGEYSPEKRKRHYAKTASQQQVSKDIYTTSIKKSEFLSFESKFWDDLNTQISFWSKKYPNLWQF